MKKYICVLLTVCLLMLSGCSASTEVLTNDLYTILEKGGVYTMQLHEPAAYSDSVSSVQGAEKAFVIKFSSVGEMKEAIEKGSFTTEQLAQMQKWFSKDTNSNVILCDTNKLYDAMLPENLSVEEVYWHGETYSIKFENGYIDVADKSRHDSFASGYDIESGTATVISVNMITDRNAKEVIFENLLGESRKMLTYDCSVNGKTINVAELYYLDGSKEIPHLVGVWGYCNGAYFMSSFSALTERPSVEWLQSFGLKPYVETETE